MPWTPGGKGIGSKETKLNVCLMFLGRVSFFISFWSLAGSMEGPVKSREGEHTSTTTVSAYVPLTLWRSLDPVVIYKFCRGGGLQQSWEGVTLTQLWRMPTYHLTLRRSLDPVVVCFASGLSAFQWGQDSNKLCINLVEPSKKKREYR